LEGLIQSGFVHRCEVCTLTDDELSDVGNEVGPQLGHAMDLRTEKRRCIGVDQAQELVAV
jgi:hypothetical protein